MRFMNAIPEDEDEILALYHSLVGTEGCAWTMNYPGIQEIEYDLSRESIFWCARPMKKQFILIKPSTLM